MADQQKQLPALGNLNSSQAPVVCEENIFHLFRFTQPVENLTYGFKIAISGELYPKPGILFCFATSVVDLSSTYREGSFF